MTLFGCKRLTQCDLIITFCSAASLHLAKIVDYRTLVLGFTENNHLMITFIDTALKGSDFQIRRFKFIYILIR